ncbi:hypothetical protein HK405_013910, partial [Cladochytrium tenue]
FLVKPASKWYRFTAKPKYQILTTEEAEAQLKKVEKGSKSFFKKEESVLETAEKVDGVKLKKEDIDILNRQMKRSQLRVTSENVKNEVKARRVTENKDLEEELDFDQEVSDDENIEFGIEDEQEAKEAKKREFGTKINRANFDDDEEEDAKPNRPTKSAKAIKKVLRKFDGDVYVSDEEANPYGDEEEEEESEEEDDIFKAIQKDKAGVDKAANEETSAAGAKTKKNEAVVKVKREGKIGSPALSGSRPTSPAVQGTRVGTPSLASSSQTPKPGTPSGFARKIIIKAGGGISPPLDDRKRKLDGVVSSPDPKKVRVAGSFDEPPPPPSAAEAIARQKEEERQRRMARRTASTASSRSPALSSAVQTPRPTSPLATSEITAAGSGSGSSSGSKANGRTPRPEKPTASPALAVPRPPKQHAPSPRPVASPAVSTPSVGGRRTPAAAGDAALLQDSDILALFDSPTPPTTVRDIVHALRDRIAQDSRNKDRLKEIVRRHITVREGI